MRFIWIEDADIRPGAGHGVDFFTDPSNSWESFFALVSGFEWLHGRPETVGVRILPAGGSYDEAFLSDARVQIERFLDGKGNWQALSGIYAHFNG